MSDPVIPKDCTYCGTALRKFRTTRGWANRTMHKKCWIKKKQSETPDFYTHFEPTYSIIERLGLG